jgi:hypothetical protein
MAIRKGANCFYVNQHHKVIAATAVTDIGFGGDGIVKFAPTFNDTTVRAMDVFATVAAAERAAATRSAMMGAATDNGRIIR